MIVATPRKEEIQYVCSLGILEREDKVLHLAWVGTNIDSIESRICPKDPLKEFKCQDQCRMFEGFKECPLDSRVKTKRDPLDKEY